MTRYNQRWYYALPKVPAPATDATLAMLRGCLPAQTPLQSDRSLGQGARIEFLPNVIARAVMVVIASGNCSLSSERHLETIDYSAKTE